MKSNLKDQRRGGFYFKDGRAYVSVTHVLGVIDKPALRYWFGEQVYYAMVKDPTLDKKTALAAPHAVSDKAKNRGSTIHSIVEAYKKGVRLDTKTIPEEFRGYAQAFYKWAESMDITVLAQEKTIFSEAHQYAGTLDLLVKHNGKKEIWVIDVKTGKGIYPEAFMQIAAYKNALEENGQPVNGAGIVLLNESGEYTFQLSNDTMVKFHGFKACLDIYRALNEEMLKKIGF